ncbi:MAG: prepilin-type N-terminal cleavage/methylation domain-containing protein [Campylobacterales bacterium]|nr:prepilin-type N-terminal cleavage/methylation domain-containing protein [Campylobacterales bacterium]HEO98636.1 prepilin-type N-terminal cleavage/methylation domain-containing protein [Campylobacterota bacterium]
MLKRKAFTLLEVLISIALLTLVMLTLNHSVAILRDSNTHLFDYLKTAKSETKVLNTLYLDIAGSDGNLTISKDEFSRLCIEETTNSLYELPTAKVCWVVLKQDNTLARVEGNNYSIPVGYESHVEVDVLVKNLELFDTYHEKGKVLVLIKERNKEAMGFMIQGITKPEPKKKDNNTTQQGNVPSSPANSQPNLI